MLPSIKRFLMGDQKDADVKAPCPHIVWRGPKNDGGWVHREDNTVVFTDETHCKKCGARIKLKEGGCRG